MKIAVITTAYLENFVRQALVDINPPCQVQTFAYESFAQISELYQSLEQDFDGFIVSGNVPKHAILKGVPGRKKPVEDFGTDLRSYYELFLRLIYGEGSNLDEGYFDLLDWLPNAKPLTTYLAEGSFDTFYQQLNEHLTGMSLQEIAAKEQQVLEKHLRLWRQKKVRFTATRFSSIAGALQEAGVNFYFVYPHIQVVRDAFDRLMTQIRLRNLRVNQTSAIFISAKEGRAAARALNGDAYVEAVAALLKKFNKETMGDFKISPGAGGCEVFTSYRVMREMTAGFTVCPLKEYIEQRADFAVCVGYGVGSTHKQALANARTANAEANIHSAGHSFFVNEKEELIGPLDKRPLVRAHRTSPYVRDTARKTGLSSMTVQKLLSVMIALDTDELSPQDLARALSITTRSANRFIRQLVDNGFATVQYERQNASRGRPERVYRLLLDPRPAKE